MNRFAFTAEERVRLIRALEVQICKRFENKAPNQISMEDWMEMQQDFRLAEAIAIPKRGKRAHVNRGYEWFFFNDIETPIRKFDRWIESMKNAKSYDVMPPTTEENINAATV